MLTLADLGRLGRHRWIVPVLAVLAAEDGARFVTLFHRIGLPRDSLVRTLGAGLAAGWIMRNPGHGHPLRPEYLLTPEGGRMATACRSVVAAQTALGLPPESLNRWSLPILRLLDEGVARFNALSHRIPAASPRALTMGLKAMIGHRLVDRQLVDRFPPGADYRLSARGQHLAAALASLPAR